MNICYYENHYDSLTMTHYDSLTMTHYDSLTMTHHDFNKEKKLF
jgi:hypothetical protein